MVIHHGAPGAAVLRDGPARRMVTARRAEPVNLCDGELWADVESADVRMPPLSACLVATRLEDWARSSVEIDGRACHIGGTI
jgi:hypothetical protein